MNLHKFATAHDQFKAYGFTMKRTKIQNSEDMRMARSRKIDSLAKVTSVRARMLSEHNPLIPDDSFEVLPNWDKFAHSVQGTMMREVKLLASAAGLNAGSHLRMGKHLSAIHELCGRQYDGTFRKIAANLGIDERQAYRLKDTYNAARANLTDKVMAAAIAMGLKVRYAGKDKPLGKYTEVFRLYPPEKNLTDSDAVDYVIRLKEKEKERRRAGRNGQT
jgi:hypothetical protein